MAKRTQEYDDDVFSLEEDLVRERRKQLIQYILVAACAVALVALALYGSVVLTHKRIEAQKQAAEAAKPIVVTDPNLPPAQAVDTNFWPAQLFPDVPVLDSAAYDTETGDGYALIDVPAATAEGFDAYIDTLTEAGASIYVRTARLCVLDLNGVEIHLVSNTLNTQVVLCREPAYAWNDPNYAAFKLPSAGRLVNVADGVGADSRVLTYRNATVLDALSYAGELTDAGWTLSGNLEPENNIFQAAFKKNNLQITVDYFSGGGAYQVRLDYLS